MPEEPVVSLRGVAKRYGRAPDGVTVLRGLDLDIHPGESLGLLGQSGMGKTTLARIIVGREEATAGRVFFKGRQVPHRPRPSGMRRAVQYVAQEPAIELNPFMTVLDLVQEPLALFRRLDAAERLRLARVMLERCGCGRELHGRRTAELSGGQRKRAAIARALVVQPELVLLDEPLAGLDLPSQAEITALLGDCRAERGMASLVITHDMTAVRALCHRLAVLHDGRIVESGDTARILARPEHPFTRRLLVDWETLASQARGRWTGPEGDALPRSGESGA